MNGIVRHEIVEINIGGMVTANPYGEEFNLTANKEYEILGAGCGEIKIRNDLGVEDWYSTDYFYECDEE